MAKCNLVAEIKLKWWVKFIYLPSLYLFADICDHIGVDLNPDYELIIKTATKGAVIKFKADK